MFNVSSYQRADVAGCTPCLCQRLYQFSSPAKPPCQTPLCSKWQPAAAPPQRPVQLPRQLSPTASEGCRQPQPALLSCLPTCAPEQLPGPTEVQLPLVVCAPLKPGLPAPPSAPCTLPPLGLALGHGMWCAKGAAAPHRAAAWAPAHAGPHPHLHPPRTLCCRCLGPPPVYPPRLQRTMPEPVLRRHPACGLTSM